MAEDFTDIEMEYLSQKYAGEGPGAEDLNPEDTAYLEQKFGIDPESTEKQEALKKYKDLHTQLQALKRDESKEIFSTSGAAGLAGLHGSFSGGFDEIYAGLNATAEVAKGLPGSLSDWSVSYWSHLADAQAAMEQAEMENPWAFGIADTLGEMALPVKTANVYASMGLGALSGYLRSKEATLETASIGGAMGGIGYGAGKAVGKVLTGISKKAKSLTGGGVKEAFGISDKTSRRLHAKQLGDRGIDDWAESMSNEIVSKVDDAGGVVKEPLLKMGQTFEETLQKVAYQRQEYGKQIGNILHSVDGQLGNNIDTGDMYNRLVAKYVSPLAKSQNPDTQQIAKGLDDYLRRTFRKETESVAYSNAERIINTNKSWQDQAPWGLLKVHNLKKDIADYLKTTKGTVKDTKSSSIDHYKKLMLGDLAGIINETVESSNLKEGTVIQFRRAKQKFADMDNGESFLQDRIDTMDSGVMGQLKQTLQARGIYISMAGKAAGMSTLSAASLAIGVNNFLNSGSAPATLAVGLKRLSARLAKDPEKYTGLAERVFSRAAISSAALGKALGEADSYFSFEDNPLRRTTEDVVKRKYDVLNMIGVDSPSVAAKLYSAIEARDQGTIRQLMGTIAGGGLPWTQSGVGWDKKAITENDRATVHGWISRNPSLSQRRQLQLNFDATSTIPDAFYAPDQPIRTPYLVYPSAKDKHGSQRRKDY